MNHLVNASHSSERLQLTGLHTEAIRSPFVTSSGASLRLRSSGVTQCKCTVMLGWRDAGLQWRAAHIFQWMLSSYFFLP